MQSLLSFSSAAVGYNARFYSTESLSGLPNAALERVLPYLSASELHRISEDLNHIGLQLNSLWKCHVKTRWKIIPKFINEFCEEKEETDYHKLYLTQHFLDLLNFCAVEKRGNDPCDIYITTLHQLSKSVGILTTSFSNTWNHAEELFKFSKYGYIIKCNAAICSYICSNKELLEILLDVTEKIQINNITDSGYSIIKYFLQLFLSVGKVKHCTFTVTGKLALENVGDIFQVCAGIKESKIKQVPCFCHTLTDLNSDCQYVNSDDAQYTFSVESNQRSAREQFVEFTSEKEDEKMVDSSVNSDTNLETSDCDEMETYKVGKGDTFNEGCSNCKKDMKPEEIDLFKEALTPLLHDLPSDNNSSTLVDSVHKNKSKFLSREGSNSLDSVNSSCSPVLQKQKRPYPFTAQGKVICIKRIKQLDLQQNGKKSVENSTLCPQGLTSLLCINGSYMIEQSKGICTAFSQVLPKWTCLKQIGLYNTDSSSQDIINSLLHKLERHELTHLILHDVIVPEDFFGRILEIIQKLYRLTGNGRNVWKPLEVLDLKFNYSDIVVPKSIDIVGNSPILGIRRLNLSMNTLRDSAVSALITLIRYDTALIELQLNHCLKEEHQVVSVLQAVRDKSQIQVLALNSNTINVEATENELLDILMSVKSLRSISLNYCQLRQEFITQKKFLEALKQHPNLKELSIMSNQLGSAAVVLLEELCCEDRPSIHSLDIGYNRIEGADLLVAARKIKSNHRHKVGHLLKYLCLSGNRVSFSVQKQLKLCFIGIVEELKADCVDFMLNI